MTRTLVHRGPDGEGYWLDNESGVALGHRRLAVVDLTSEGAQPMTSSSGRFVISYNGEVYNFPQLRERLEKMGVVFRGRSDTEVILAAIEAWGVKPAVQEFVGMFAFALWDRRDRKLWLCRDRLGKKPLYFGVQNGTLVFASELRGVLQFPGIESEIDRDSLTLFLRHNYIPAPRSVYRGISKLEPVHLASFSVRNGGGFDQADQSYWSALEVARLAKNAPLLGTLDELTEQLNVLLSDAVRIRMISDVPLGVFLSGGIDSSLIAALMQHQSTAPVKTFTIGFEEEAFNEADYARDIAARLGTEHTEVFVSPQDALDVIPSLASIYDEPFADSSQIPTVLVSQIARRDVTVALSGDGGDELFCGYNRYLWWRQIWSVVGPMPAVIRGLVGRGMTGISTDRWNSLLAPMSRFLPGGLRYSAPGERIHKLAEVLRASNPDALYQRLLSHWTNPEAIVIGGREPPTPLSINSHINDKDLFTEHMMLLDTVGYLPDDILVKVDRAGMSASLETRAPLLDHRVFEFAARVPLRHKLKGSQGKLILRKVLGRYLPETMFDRPKTGFGVPIDVWLRGPLRDWAEDLLSERRLSSQGFFRPAPIRQLWQAHLEQRQSAHYLLWDILMFQAWLDQARDSSTRSEVIAASYDAPCPGT